MGIRELVATPWGRPAARGMQALNARHPWSHNDHFHSWILHELPERRTAALDVGCGRGELLAALAPLFDRVEGIDVDPGMREQASQRTAGIPNVEVTARSLEQIDPLADGPVDGQVDLVTMVAVLHHLDLEEALSAVRSVLAPGGRFLAVGLAPPETLSDHLWDVASMLTNPLIGMVKHPWPRRAGVQEAQIPVKDPSIPLEELRERAVRVMPGIRVRRHLAFRHSLEWTKR